MLVFVNFFLSHSVEDMVFFDRLTDVNLETLAFLAIKNRADRQMAAEVLLMGTAGTCERMCSILGEHTSHRYLYISKNDRLGLLLELTLRKPSGFVRVSLNKKRSASVTVLFLTPRLDKAISKVYFFKHDCDVTWVKCILCEFDPFIVRYIKNRCSNRLRDLNRLIKRCLVLPRLTLSVHIDIPGYICLLDGV